MTVILCARKRSRRTRWSEPDDIRDRRRPGALDLRPQAKRGSGDGFEVDRVDGMASIAAELDVDVRTAVAVSRQYRRPFRVRSVAVTPPHESQYRRNQIDTLGGDDGLGPAAGAGLLVGLDGQDAFLDEHVEPRREEVAWTAEDAFDLTEPGRAVPDLTQDQDGPLLPWSA